jgi:hypothetical protein
MAEISPTITAKNLNANYAHWLYLQAMMLDFIHPQPFNTLMMGYEKNFQWDD